MKTLKSWKKYPMINVGNRKSSQDSRVESILVENIVNGRRFFTTVLG